MQGKGPFTVFPPTDQAFAKLPPRTVDVINRDRSLNDAQGVGTSAAESFFAAGPQKLVDSVAQYLGRAHRAGSLKVSDPAMAANQYLSLFLGLAHVRALLGLTLSKRRDDQGLLAANVELFLKAHATGKSTRDKRRASEKA